MESLTGALLSNFIAPDTYWRWTFLAGLGLLLLLPPLATTP
ncbi:hypothetical protein ACFP51_34045 [Streptomyces pratens]|uniref:Uncharacterized protein n=1 Tax=Streptomyces pratens TaxID=887456 RepID=A0ABW1LRU0_9ACTN